MIDDLVKATKASVLAGMASCSEGGKPEELIHPASRIPLSDFELRNSLFLPFFTQHKQSQFTEFVGKD